MGIQVSDEVINSWGKHGLENVIFLMEKIQDRTDIENPIGYITTVLNASKGQDIVASTSEEENILAYLISYFRKSKEPKPNWFVKQQALEKIEMEFKMNKNEALSTFEKIQPELYEALNIEVSVVESYTEENFEKKKKELEERIRQMRE